MPTPRQELADAIDMFEGLYQDDWNDRINIVGGRMIGTMRGVAPPALAAHRRVPIDSLTPEIMKSVTADEAADIGEDHFYYNTGLDRLRWGPATASLLDHGWGAGLHWTRVMAQRCCGAEQDGRIGPKTVAAWDAYIDRVGWEQATRDVLARRQKYYDDICAINPVLLRFREGWRRRANWFSPDNPKWWGRWVDELKAVA